MMVKRFNLAFAEAIATLIGTVIGAGVLAIPYVMSKAGFLTGLLNLFILSGVTLFLYLSLGEVVLRTKGSYQLTGYAGKYTGSFGRKLMAVCLTLSTYGAIVAYLIGIGRSMFSLFPLQGTFTLAGFSLTADLLFSFCFFLFGSAIIYYGINGVKRTELFLTFFLIIVAIITALIPFADFHAANVMEFNPSKLFIPYGVILFALTGAVAIPEMREELKDAKRFKKAIIVGTLIPVFTYFLFSLSVVGSCGKGTSEIAVNCIADKFGIGILWMGNIFAILAMGTSFLTLGLGLKEVYNYDYKYSARTAWILSCIVPFFLFLIVMLFLPEEQFFRTLDLTGGIAVTIEGVLLILMFERAKKLGDRKPEYSLKSNRFLSGLIILIFLAGLVYSVISYLGLLRF